MEAPPTRANGNAQYQSFGAVSRDHNQAKQAVDIRAAAASVLESYKPRELPHIADYPQEGTFTTRAAGRQAAGGQTSASSKFDKLHKASAALSGARAFLRQDKVTPQQQDAWHLQPLADAPLQAEGSSITVSSLLPQQLFPTEPAGHSTASWSSTATESFVDGNLAVAGCQGGNSIVPQSTDEDKGIPAIEEDPASEEAAQVDNQQASTAAPSTQHPPTTSQPSKPSSTGMAHLRFPPSHQFSSDSSSDEDESPIMVQRKLREIDSTGSSPAASVSTVKSLRQKWETPNGAISKPMNDSGSSKQQESQDPRLQGQRPSALMIASRQSSIRSTAPSETLDAGANGSSSQPMGRTSTKPGPTCAPGATRQAPAVSRQPSVTAADSTSTAASFRSTGGIAKLACEVASAALRSSQHGSVTLNNNTASFTSASSAIHRATDQLQCEDHATTASVGVGSPAAPSTHQASTSHQSAQSPGPKKKGFFSFFKAKSKDKSTATAACQTSPAPAVGPLQAALSMRRATGSSGGVPDDVHMLTPRASAHGEQHEETGQSTPPRGSIPGEQQERTAGTATPPRLSGPGVQPSPCHSPLQSRRGTITHDGPPPGMGSIPPSTAASPRPSTSGVPDSNLDQISRRATAEYIPHASAGAMPTGQEPAAPGPLSAHLMATSRHTSPLPSPRRVAEPDLLPRQVSDQGSIPGSTVSSRRTTFETAVAAFATPSRRTTAEPPLSTLSGPLQRGISGRHNLPAEIGPMAAGLNRLKGRTSEMEEVPAHANGGRRLTENERLGMVSRSISAFEAVPTFRESRSFNSSKQSRPQTTEHGYLGQEQEQAYSQTRDLLAKPDQSPRKLPDAMDSGPDLAGKPPKAPVLTDALRQSLRRGGPQQFLPATQYAMQVEQHGAGPYGGAVAAAAAAAAVGADGAAFRAPGPATPSKGGPGTVPQGWNSVGSNAGLRGSLNSGSTYDEPSLRQSAEMPYVNTSVDVTSQQFADPGGANLTSRRDTIRGGDEPDTQGVHMQQTNVRMSRDGRVFPSWSTFHSSIKEQTSNSFDFNKGKGLAGAGSDDGGKPDVAVQRSSLSVVARAALFQQQLANGVAQRTGPTPAASPSSSERGQQRSTSPLRRSQGPTMVWAAPSAQQQRAPAFQASGPLAMAASAVDAGVPVYYAQQARINPASTGGMGPSSQEPAQSAVPGARSLSAPGDIVAAQNYVSYPMPTKAPSANLPQQDISMNRAGSGGLQSATSLYSQAAGLTPESMREDSYITASSGCTPSNSVGNTPTTALRPSPAGPQPPAAIPLKASIESAGAAQMAPAPAKGQHQRELSFGYAALVRQPIQKAAAPAAPAAMSAPGHRRGVSFAFNRMPTIPGVNPQHLAGVAEELEELSKAIRRRTVDEEDEALDEEAEEAAGVPGVPGSAQPPPHQSYGGASSVPTSARDGYQMVPGMQGARAPGPGAAALTSAAVAAQRANNAPIGGPASGQQVAMHTQQAGWQASNMGPAGYGRPLPQQQPPPNAMMGPGAAYGPAIDANAAYYARQPQPQQQLGHNGMPGAYGYGAPAMQYSNASGPAPARQYQQHMPGGPMPSGPMVNGHAPYGAPAGRPPGGYMQNDMPYGMQNMAQQMPAQRQGVMYTPQSGYPDNNMPPYQLLPPSRGSSSSGAASQYDGWHPGPAMGSQPPGPMPQQMQATYGYGQPTPYTGNGYMPGNMMPPQYYQPQQVAYAAPRPAQTPVPAMPAPPGQQQYYQPPPSPAGAGPAAGPAPHMTHAPTPHPAVAAAMTPARNPAPPMSAKATAAAPAKTPVQHVAVPAKGGPPPPPPPGGPPPPPNLNEPAVIIVPKRNISNSTSPVSTPTASPPRLSHMDAVVAAIKNQSFHLRRLSQSKHPRKEKSTLSQSVSQSQTLQEQMLQHARSFRSKVRPVDASDDDAEDW